MSAFKLIQHINRTGSVVINVNDIVRLNDVTSRIIHEASVQCTRSYILPMLPVNSMFDFLAGNTSFVPIIQIVDTDIITNDHYQLFKAITNQGDRKCKSDMQCTKHKEFVQELNPIFVTTQPLHAALTSRCMLVDTVQPDTSVGELSSQE